MKNGKDVGVCRAGAGFDEENRGARRRPATPDLLGFPPEAGGRKDHGTELAFGG
jgi:hypothetical protein